MKFTTKRTVVTCGVNTEIGNSSGFALFVLDSLKKHFSCNWGDSTEEDKQANDYALAVDDRILSAYVCPKTDKKIWIISEHDRSTTTVLFPEEY